MDLKVGTISASVALVLAPLKAGLAEAKSNVRAFSTSLKGDLESVEARSAQMSAKVKSSINTVSNSFLAGGTAIAVGLGAASKASLDFEKELANVDSIAKLTGEQMKDLHDDVLKLASDSKIRQGPVDLAKALYDINSSGFSGAAALDILKQSAYGASAGMTTTATSARAITAVLNSGISGINGAKEAIDVLFREVDLGVNTFEGLANSIGRVLPRAKTFGVSLQEVSAALAAMTRRGLSVDEATTALDQLLVHIAKPSKEARKLFEELGISYGYAGLKATGFTGILQQMSEKTETNKQKLINLFPEVRGMGAALTLTDEKGRQYSEMLRLMATASDGAGSAQAALERQNKSGAAQLEILKKELEIAAIAAGDGLAPAMGKVTEAVRTAVKWFRDLSQETKNNIVQGAAWVAGSLLLLGTIGKIIIVVAELKTAFATLAITANASWVSMLGPIALVAAAVAGVLLLIRQVNHDMQQAIQQGRQQAWDRNVAAHQSDPGFVAGQIRERESANARHRQKIADIRASAFGTPLSAPQERALYEEQQSIKANEKYIREQRARIASGVMAPDTHAPGFVPGATVPSVVTPVIPPLKPFVSGGSGASGKSKADKDAEREREDRLRDEQEYRDRMFELSHQEEENEVRSAAQRVAALQISGEKKKALLAAEIKAIRDKYAKERAEEKKQAAEKAADAAEAEQEAGQKAAQSWVDGYFENWLDQAAIVEKTKEQQAQVEEAEQEAGQKAAQAWVDSYFENWLGTAEIQDKAKEAAKQQQEAEDEEFDRLFKLQTERREAQEEAADRKLEPIRRIADKTQGIFEGAFENLFEHGPKDFFKNVLDGFKQMISQMVAELLAKAAVFGLLDLFTGGGAGAILNGKGGGGFWSFLGFDDAGNDATAQRWGFDFADHFSRGVSRFQNARLQPAGAGAGGGTVVHAPIHVNMSGVQIRTEVDIEQVADKVAWHASQRLNVYVGRGR